MAHLNIRRSAAATFFALAATIGVGTIGAGQASAETIVPMTRCWGLSPYIIDQPFSPARLFVTEKGPGRVDAAVRDASTPWGALIRDGGYDSVGRLDWRNVTTGRTGTNFAAARINGYSGGPYFVLNTDPGTVHFTFSAVNSNALWAIPTTSCSGTMQVQ